MKSEQEIRARMKHKLLRSFSTENEDVAKRWQAEAEALAWVIGMTTNDFYDFWEEVQKEYEEKYEGSQA